MDYQPHCRTVQARIIGANADERTVSMLRCHFQLPTWQELDFSGDCNSFCLRLLGLFRVMERELLFAFGRLIGSPLRRFICVQID